MTAAPPELHLFIIWSRGREREEQILADLRTEFDVLDVVETSWDRARFSENLTRFYGEALPSGSEKERHCGNGPFLVVVVRDRLPRLESLRTKARGLQVVDVRTLEAKERYRSWTNGGHRIHATLEPREFAHDLYLLFGRLPPHYDGIVSWDGNVRSWECDLVGTHGWRSSDELLTALEVTLGHVVLLEPVAEEKRLAVLVGDPWWAAVVANGRPGLSDPWASAHDVDVEGAAWRLDIHSPEPPSRPSRLGELIGRARAGAIDRLARLSSRKAGLALVYHRLGDPPGDPRYELVPRLGLDAFARQLDLLRRRYRVVAASELPQAVASRRPGGQFPVALTFDDSLASHVRLAAPLLRERGLPATFFPNGASAPNAFWWRRLQRAVDRQTLEASALPVVDGSDVAAALERRPGAIRRLAAAIERAAPSRRRELAAALGDDPMEDQLGPEGVAALAAQGFEVGFHTLEHDLLPALDDETLGRALTDGRAALEAAAGAGIRLLAYPHGKADERVAAAARDAGYEFAYAGGGRAVDAKAEPLLLPRWEPPFTGGASFELAVARRLRD